VERVVFASSGGVVYGESDRLPHREDAAKLPVSPYGVSKLASEFYLAAYSELYGIKAVSLRYANVYGPRQSPHGEAGVVAIFGNRLKSGHPLTVYGDGSQTRDYVFVTDVARANIAATTCDVAQAATIDDLAYNIGTGVETSVNALVESLFEATGRSAPVENAPARAGELMRSAVSPERAERDWGWRPAVGLTAGLKRTYEWIVEEAA
jgi:UDP-glucose 4-epimerase